MGLLSEVVSRLCSYKGMQVLSELTSLKSKNMMLQNLCCYFLFLVGFFCLKRISYL